jgi:hypothetical protein
MQSKVLRSMLLPVVLILICAGATPAGSAPAGWGTSTLIYNGAATWPSINGDGTALAFLDPYAGPDENHRAVMALTRTGAPWGSAQIVGSNGVLQTGQVIVLPEYTHPVISQDGLTMAYLGYTGLAYPDAGFGIYLAARSGGAWSAPALLNTGLPNTHYTVGLDGQGQRVAYCDYPFLGTRQVYVSGRNGGSWSSPLRVSDENLGGGEPSISADGRAIAFVRNARLALVEQTAQGWGAPQTLTANVTMSDTVEYPQISRDGNSIFYWLVHLEPSGGYQVRVSQDLYMLRRVGPVWSQTPIKVTATPVIPSGAVDGPAAADASGTRVVYARAIQDHDVFVGARLEATEWSNGAWSAPVLLTEYHYGAWDRFPTLSGDGRTLVYEANWIVYNGTQGLRSLTNTTAPPARPPQPVYIVAQIPVTGGSLFSPTDGTRYIIPSGVFTAGITLTHTIWPSNTVPGIGGLGGIGHAFDGSVMFGPGGLPLQPLPGKALTVTVDYGASGPVREDTLGLWWWTGAAWSQSGITSTLNLSAHSLTAQLSHLTLFAILGRSERIYLPLLQRF